MTTDPADIKTLESSPHPAAQGFRINQRCINCGTCWQFDDVALLLPGHGRRHAFAPGAWCTALEQTLRWNRRHHET